MMKTMSPFQFVETSTKTPKYQQLINGILGAIETGILKIGDRLPSINEASEEYYLSRDTVERAYTELYKLGVITSVNRRGFFITGQSNRTTTKVFLLVGSITEYNKAVYSSFCTAFGKNLHVDIYTYNYKKNQFCETINNHLGDYHYYVLMPHLIDECADLVKCIKKISNERLIILDQDLPALGKGHSVIGSDGNKEIYRLMSESHEALQKYEGINLVLSNDEYFPSEMITGFIDFCEDNQIEYQILDGMADEEIQENQAYWVVDDTDLVEVVKQAEAKNLAIGRQIGIVSLHDSCFKEVLAGGITVMTNCPEKMGKHLASIIKEGKQLIDLPMELKWRKSL